MDDRIVRRSFVWVGALLALGFGSQAVAAEVQVAVAANFTEPAKEIAAAYEAKTHHHAALSFGPSGQFYAQISHGAPFEVFLSADADRPAQAEKEGFAVPGTRFTYAIGRLVLWSRTIDAGTLKVADLTRADIQKIAIANPQHAPYGQRAEEALRASGVWEDVEGKLVFGENISQAAQFAQSGNAQVGMIALSLVLGPQMAGKGSYSLVPDNLHQALEQGFVITRRAADSALAKAFADYMVSGQTRAVMVRYGFALPGEAIGH